MSYRENSALGTNTQQAEEEPGGAGGLTHSNFYVGYCISMFLSL